MTKKRTSIPSVKSVNSYLERTVSEGLKFIELKRFEDAEKIFRDVLSVIPDHSTAKANLGVALAFSGQYVKAAEVLHPVYEQNPKNADILKVCSQVYFQMGRFDLAIQFLKRLINLDETNYEAWLSLTTAAAANLQHIEALAYATKALELNKTDPRSHLNLGSALLNIGREKDALFCFETALMLEPDNISALSNCALVYERLGEPEKAVEIVDRSIQLFNSNDQQRRAELEYKKSYPLLAIGRLKEGWACYEQGFAPLSRNARNPKRVFKAPRWDGSEIRGKRLLIWKEQGLGDEIMFSEPILDAMKLCDDIVIECDHRLVAIFERSFLGCEARPQNFSPHDLRSPTEDFDFQIPIGSLMALFRSDISQFGNHRGHLKPDSSRVALFEERLAPYKATKRIGICWRSGHLAPDRNAGYTSLSDWRDILALPGFTFVNLQYSDCQAELDRAKEAFGVPILNWKDVDLKDDQESVAAIIANLDVVISAGTAVAQLTGALGVNLILFGTLRGWTKLGETNYPWYASCDFIDIPFGAPAASALVEVREKLINVYSK